MKKRLRPVLLAFCMILSIIAWSLLQRKTHEYRAKSPAETSPAAAASQNSPSSGGAVSHSQTQPRQPNPQTEAPTPDSIIKELVDNAEILLKSESAPTSDGYVHRRLIVKTDYKYPVYLEQDIHLDPTTQEERIIKSTQYIADHILVRLKQGTTEADLEKLCQKHGATIRKKMLSGAYLVSFPEYDLDTVSSAMAQFNEEKDSIAYAEKDFLSFITSTFPNDPSFNQLYGLHNTGQKIKTSTGTPDADIDAPEAWDTYTGSTNILIAVIDTGIDYTHEDLAANCWINPGEIPNNKIDDDGNGFVDDVRGWDFFNDDNDPKDDHDHGTHCAGTIAAVGNNGIGVAGVNWTARLIALKFIGSEGWGANSDAVEAFYYCSRMKVRVASNSWGGDDWSQEMETALAVLQSSNCLAICAAGNSSVNNDITPHYPSSYTNDNVIAVAATDNSDRLAGFSCYGLTSVDVGAPGQAIYSTIIGNSYEYFNGTSMATPHVAGCAAFVIGLNTNAGVMQVRNALLESCDPLPALDGKCAAGGRINLLKLIGNVGLDVESSTPSEWELTSSITTNFMITFTDACNLNTIQASDFLVNGIPANSVITNSQTRFTFNYTTPPATAQGPHTMSIHSNSITRAGDNRGNLEWSAVFYYDLNPLTVASTIPASTSIAPVPLTSLTINFNEAINTNTIDISDLELSQGSVTGFNIIDADSVRFLLDGVTEEPEVTVTLPPWKIYDTFGNPNAIWTSTLGLDYDDPLVISTNMTQQSPKGSMVSIGTRTVRISTSTDVDSLTIDMDAGQTLAVIARTLSSSLKPAITLKNPSNTTIGTAGASAAGQDACLQAVICATAGTYTADISGMNSTTGDAEITIIVNATPEAENYDGASNNSLATAQNLNSTFASLTGSAARTAVLGGITGADTEDWYAISLTNQQYLSLMILGHSNEATALAFYNSSAQLLAAGQAGVRNADSAMDQFRAPSAGTYYVRVTGPASSYLLMAVQNASLDLEKNNALDEAMDISATKTVVGSLGKKEALFGIQRYPDNVTYIASYDPDTGELIRRFRAPVDAQAEIDCVNIAYNGEHIWFNDGRGSPNWRMFYKLDEDTGEVLASFHDYELSEGATDLGCTASNVWVFTEGFAYKRDSETFDPIGYMVDLYSDWVIPWGATCDIKNSHLYTIDQENDSMWRHKMDGNVLKEVTTDPVGYSSGMAVVGDEIFISETSGIGTINALTVYDRSTMTFKRRMFLPTDFELSGLGGDGVQGNNHDWYRFNANAGDHILLETLTPAHDSTQPNEPYNIADPVIELYRTDGTLITSNDNGAGDSINARIAYTIPSSGVYFVKVDVVNNQFGDYALQLSGTSADTTPFTVSSTDPLNGSYVPDAPATLTVNFNQAVSIPSIQASDLTINSVPCTGFTVENANTIVFDLPAITEGDFTVALGAGAVTNLQGSPLTAYSGSFHIDSSAPTVTATSISQNGVTAAGLVECTITFNKTINSEQVITNPAASLLTGEISGPRSANEISYNTNSHALTLTYTNLPDDVYRLTLVSGDGFFEDLGGNDLDGEPLGLPSGNGTAGGNYTLDFVADATTYALPASFITIVPTGTLAYASSSFARILTSSDTDNFTVDLDPGQIISLSVDGDANLRPSVSLSGSAGVLGTSTASAQGGAAVINGVSVAAGGTYTVAVSAANNTTGIYELNMALNAVFENEALTGTANNSIATAQNCDTGFLSLGRACSRNSIIGQGDGLPQQLSAADGYGYRGCVIGTQYEDISQTGHLLTGPGAANGTFEITPADLDGFTFPFYGQLYSNLFVSVEGLISFTSAYSANGNNNLTASPAQPVIAAYWDDLWIDGSAESALLWQLRGTAPERRLIIQWKNAAFNDSGSPGDPDLNFQAILNETDGSIQLNYASVYDTSISADGKKATAGIKDAGAQGDNTLLLAYNNNTNMFARSGNSVLIATGLTATPSPDIYAFNLNKDDELTLALRGQNTTNASFELYNASSTLLASSSPTNTNYDAIRQYTVPSSGTYYASVRATRGAQYGLVVMKNGVLDLEDNSSIAKAQDITPFGIALGGVARQKAVITPLEYYKILLTSGDTITIESRTPFDGANQPDNYFDPRLVLYNPSGTSVATNLNSAADGRNALITYTATQSGYHTILITATSGTGAYTLHVSGGPLPAEAPVVSITATDATLGEQMSDSNGTFTITRTAVNLETPLTVRYTLSGSASNSVDYVNISTSAVISASFTSKAINIIAISDDIPEGDESVILTINSSAAYTIGTGTAQMYIKDKPADGWRHTIFSAQELANPEISGHTADPDGDGLPNIWEYAVGQNPKTPDQTRVPALVITNGYLAMQYNQAKNATDITCRPEARNSLSTGAWSTNGFTELNRTDEGQHWSVTVRDSAPMNTSTSRFMRLTIEIP